jgi:hypothetical protein
LALLRRREVWLPTLWGWLALLLVGAVAALSGARSIHPFLALSQPVGARILVVEGWMEPEGLDQAIAMFRARGYERILTTGGPVVFLTAPPIQTTYADLAADYLKQHGIAPFQVTAVPTPKTAENHTFLSAVAVREWAKRSAVKLDALDVYSVGTHARRSRLLYEIAFGTGVKVGVYAARSSDYDAGAWWRTTVGLRDVLTQAAGLLWVRCCFHPPSGPPDAN